MELGRVAIARKEMKNELMKKLFPLLALAACTQAAPVVPQPPQDTCNAADFALLVGQDATALETVLLLGKVRVIRPGQAVTMDFRQERINFMIDEANRIEAIRCG